jgi:copper chaperone CopZ
MLEYPFISTKVTFTQTRRNIMKSETLQLAGTLDEGTALNVAHLLNAVKGVSKVVISTASKSVDIDFDDDVTSTQELSTLLQQAGFGLKKAAHGEGGMCCGSCGS